MRGPSPLERLHQRISRAAEKNRTLTMSPIDVDWFVVSGAYAKLLEAVANEAVRVARDRIEQRGDHLDLLELLCGERKPDETAGE